MTPGQAEDLNAIPAPSEDPVSVAAAKLLARESKLPLEILSRLQLGSKRYTELLPLLEGRHDNNLTVALKFLQHQAIVDRVSKIVDGSLLHSYEITNFGQAVLERVRLYRAVSKHVDDRGRSKHLDETLSNEWRRLIYDYVSRHPNCNVKEIYRHAGIPYGQLIYHLTFLEKRGHLRRSRSGYVTTSQTIAEEDLYGIVKHDIMQRIVIMLLLAPRLRIDAIEQRIAISKPTLKLHLKFLEQMSIVRAERTSEIELFFVPEARKCAKVLILGRAQLNSAHVDRFAELWLSMNPLEEYILNESTFGGSPSHLVDIVFGANAAESRMVTSYKDMR